MYVETYPTRYVCRKISNTLCMWKHIQYVMYVEKYQIRMYIEKYQIRHVCMYVETYSTRYVCRNISNTCM